MDSKKLRKTSFISGTNFRTTICIGVVFAILAALSLNVFTADKQDDTHFSNFKSQSEQAEPFADISSDDWFAGDAEKARSYGLISGVSETEFAPSEKITFASGMVMAARLRSIYETGVDDLYVGEPWYSDYEQYALDNDIIAKRPDDYDAYITRAQFARMLTHALPDEALTEINSVEDNSIPDVSTNSEYGSDIYKLYRAGIIVGSDDVHRAFPDAYLPRSEAASILIRMADPSRRQKVILTGKIKIYSEKGEEKTINALDYKEYESNGWNTHSEITVYAPDGRSSVIKKAEKEAWLAVGWYDYPVMTMYAADGRMRTVPTREKDAWLAVDWYDYPVMTVYAADGRTKVIPKDEKDAWLAVDWYDHPVLTVYALDGRTSVIAESEKEAWLAVGWYDSPVITVYAPDGRERVIPEKEKDAWLAVGWYGTKFVPMPSVLKSKKLTTTDIPVISIGTGGKSVSSNTTYVPCTVNTFNVEEDIALLNAKGGIRLRGNASRSAKPFRIKFDSKQNLLGLNDGAKAKSWVLLNYPDGAVENVKNDIAFRMGRMLMEPDGIYCSDARFVHVYLNEGFMGTYLLCEQTQANKHRVDVNEPEDGYTGTDVGYLVEIDNYSEPPYFRMNYENAYVTDRNGKGRKLRSAAYSIKSDTFSQEQKDFIAKYVRGVFQIVYQACEKGNYLTFDENYNVVASSFTNAQETVEAVTDMNSIVDMYILYEIMHDFDVGEGSFFMCVDFSESSKHPKLTFIAPWDFNWTCMNSATGAYYASTFCTDSFMSTFGDRSNPWFIILYKQWWFRELVCKKWTQMGGSPGIDKCLDEERAILDKYQPDINRRKSGAVSGGKYYLNWIHNRSVWLDSIWLK